jgi:uncharacterized damage-inducible protein DinB
MIKRPLQNEYPPFAGRYVDLVGDGQVLDILENAKDATYGFFLSLADRADLAYAEGKWTIKQVIGHMSDTERIFAYRLLVFSHEAIELPGFDQDIYMATSAFNSRSLEDLANEFRTTRESSLYLIRSLTEEQSTQKGIASGHPVSVRGLAYMIAGHEMHHINILKERYL